MYNNFFKRAYIQEINKHQKLGDSAYVPQPP